MKSLSVIFLLCMLMACEQTIDPFEKKSNCILSLITQPTGNLLLSYDAKGKLFSRVFTEKSGAYTQTNTYFYGTNGKLVEAKMAGSGSNSYSVSFKTSYGTDGRVSLVTWFDAAGKPNGADTFIWGTNSLKLEWRPTGSVNPTAIGEYTFTSGNITRYFYTAYSNFATGTKSFTYEQNETGFDSFLNHEFIWKDNCQYPYPSSKNNPKTNKQVFINYTNGVAQVPTATTLTYTYTYGTKSLVTLSMQEGTNKTDFKYANCN